MPSETATTAATLWQRKALVWPKSVDSSSPYWDTPWNQNDGITYESLVLACASMVHLLQSQISEHGTNNSNSNNIVVLAIPEGPLMALWIVAIHTCTQAILVPMDPHDGTERIKRMIQTCRPQFIITLPGRDQDIMLNIIQNVPELHIRLLDAAQLQWETWEYVKQTDPNILQKHFSTVPETQLLTTTILQVLHIMTNSQSSAPAITNTNRLSHICFTSGSTGTPKGCQSSLHALTHYCRAKNKAHGISQHSTVLVASTISFDPCLSDILATIVHAQATIFILPRHHPPRLDTTNVTHVLATPTVWKAWMNEWQQVPPPTLQVVALGGEAISSRLGSKWAQQPFQFYATYGVTEACVYQTMGQVQHATCNECHVGPCLEGNFMRIDSPDNGTIGEVILYGNQLDEYSGYVNQPELTKERFFLEHGQYYYKTGDLGFIQNGNLHILGRSQGQEEMVKVNGVRIELGEVEAALVNDHVISDGLAVLVKANNDDDSNQIHAHVVLTATCLHDFRKTSHDIPDTGILCSTGPLLVLLRAQCQLLLKAAAVPLAFIIIPRVPLSPTGKCDKRLLPPLKTCTTTLDCLLGSSSIPLWNYGISGAVVADQIVECLNLQGCQKDLLTNTANFCMLGGDSLGSTRIVRALYAYHFDLKNTRDLGGSFGALEGAFAVGHLISSKTLQDYVDWLDANGVCGPKNTCTSATHNDCHYDPTRKDFMDDETNRSQQELFDALVETITMEHFSIALELLQVGADPNWGAHGGRLSKLRHRIDRRKTFFSNPLHLACSKGHSGLVETLLRKGCKCNAPDASGMFPIHIAAGMSSADDDDDMARRKCLELLLDVAGAPLSMKDGSKQTVLHCAARAGNVECLRFLLVRWKQGLQDGTICYYNDKHKGGQYDWTDHWYRTPVHWAVLNGKADALTVLLEGGCSADPPRANNTRTSAELESPLEICERVHGNSKVGETMTSTLMKWKRVQETQTHVP